MKSTGWINSKIEDNSFLFSKKGDDGGWWMVMVEPQGNGFLTFSLGSPEEILHKAELPITEVSVYEISDFAKNWMDDLDYGDEEED